MSQGMPAISRSKEDKEMEALLELPETTLLLVWRDSFQVSNPRRGR